MLRSRDRAILDAQVRLEGTAKELEQNLEADLCDGWVITALAELVADEGVLGPGELVEAGDDAGLAQLSANEVAARVGHVSVFDAEDEGNLSLELAEEVEGVVAVRGRVGGGVGGLVWAEGTGVDVGGKVGDAGGDARIKLEESWSEKDSGIYEVGWLDGHTAARVAR
jgi:hypothetical protein